MTPPSSLVFLFQQDGSSGPNRARLQHMKCSFQARLLPFHMEVDGDLCATCNGSHDVCRAVAILTRPTLRTPGRALFPGAMARRTVRRSVRTTSGTDQVAEPSSDRACGYPSREQRRPSTYKYSFPVDFGFPRRLSGEYLLNSFAT